MHVPTHEDVTLHNKHHQNLKINVMSYFKVKGNVQNIYVHTNVNGINEN
jgi:hypothetical protein